MDYFVARILLYIDNVAVNCFVENIHTALEMEYTVHSKSSGTICKINKISLSSEFNQFVATNDTWFQTI